MKTFKRTCLIIALNILMTMGITGQNFTSFKLCAPEKCLPEIERVAVNTFEVTKGSIASSSGNVITDYLTNSLLENNRGMYAITSLIGTSKPSRTYDEGATTKTVAVVEREQLERVMAEQKLGVSGLLDESNAAEVGRLLGVDATIIGSVSVQKVEERREYSNLAGDKYYKYAKVITTQARMKIISVETGQIVGTKETSVKQESIKKEKSGLDATDQMIIKCLKDMAINLADYFTPHFEKETYKFQKVKMKEFKAQANSVEDFIKNATLDKAWSVYNAMYEVDPYNAKVAGNLAHLYHIHGNYEKAESLYAVAAELDNEEYQEMLLTTHDDLIDYKRLNSFDIYFPEYNPKIGIGEYVTTKGNKKDRYEVYIEPADNSNVIAKVPGGTQFGLLEDSGDWKKIQLLGGKEGYIFKKSLD